jgi:hypothetical protein
MFLLIATLLFFFFKTIIFKREWYCVFFNNFW